MTGLEPWGIDEDELRILGRIDSGNPVTDGLGLARRDADLMADDCIH